MPPQPPLPWSKILYIWIISANRTGLIKRRITCCDSEVLSSRRRAVQPARLGEQGSRQRGHGFATRQHQADLIGRVRFHERDAAEAGRARKGFRDMLR